MANSISWQAVAVVVAAFACFTALALRGLIPQELISTAIVGIIGWLIPSPLKGKDGAQ